LVTSYNHQPGNGVGLFSKKKINNEVNEYGKIKKRKQEASREVK